MSTEDDLQEPLLERLSATPELDDPTKTSKKRKRGADLEQGEKKAAKKSKSKKGKADEGDELDTDAGINQAFSHMDSQLLADYVAQRTKKYESDLSQVELEDKYVPGLFEFLIRRRELIQFHFSNCDSRYNLVGSTKNGRQSPKLPREIRRQHNEVMVSIKKEWGSSYNRCSGSRVESGKSGKVCDLGA